MFIFIIELLNKLHLLHGCFIFQDNLLRDLPAKVYNLVGCHIK